MSIKNKKAMRSTNQSDRKAPKTEDKPLNTYFNTDYKVLSTQEPYRAIISVIGTGEQNAAHLKDIIKLTGITNRIVRKYIEDLRRSGAVIIANNKGYFFPSDEGEIKRYIRQEESRAKSIFYTLKSARQFLSELGA